MMSGDLVLGKDALELAVKGTSNDVLAAPKDAKRLLAAPDGYGKDTRLHNPLNRHAADDLTDAKKPIAVFDFRRLIDEKTGFQAWERHTSIPTGDDFSTPRNSDRSIAETLTQFNFGAAS